MKAEFTLGSQQMPEVDLQSEAIKPKPASSKQKDNNLIHHLGRLELLSSQKNVV